MPRKESVNPSARARRDRSGAGAETDTRRTVSHAPVLSPAPKPATCLQRGTNRQASVGWEVGWWMGALCSHAVSRSTTERIYIAVALQAIFTRKKSLDRFHTCYSTDCTIAIVLLQTLHCLFSYGILLMQRCGSVYYHVCLLGSVCFIDEPTRASE